MNAILKAVLSSMIESGRLEVVTSDGKVETLGPGPGPAVRIRFTSPAVERAVLLDPELALGEAFMDGGLVIEEGRIYDFLDLVLRHSGGIVPAWWVKAFGRFRYLVRRIHQHNTLGRSRANIAHHYDLDGALYRLFLESDKQYSCAYFETPDSTLEEAQLAKKRHLAAKLLLRPGQKVLDIGCGWGGLGLYLAEMGGGDVTGVTLSEEQFGIANARAEERALADRARFLLKDYRALEGPFDRIVSVGMFEHVGVGHYDEYFAQIANLLKDDGVALIHSIGRSEGPGITNPWIAKYIFPGGYIPALSEVLPAIERAGLLVTDIEILRLHYAETLKAWRERFMARWDEAAQLYDERFCRMWEFYLAASETAFRHQDMMVFQIQLTRKQDAVPLTRDYILHAEQALRAREGGRLHPPLRLAGE